MRTSDFDFYLPEELIAQTPLLDRSSSRLLSLDSKTGAITDKHFTDMVAELQEGDALVLNNTRVLPARLHGVKPDTRAYRSSGAGTISKETSGNARQTREAGQSRYSHLFRDGRLTAEVTQSLEHGGRI